MEDQLNHIASRFNPADPYACELHGSPMRSGRGEWKGLPMEKRIQAIKDALGIIAERHPRVRLFASVVDRDAVKHSDMVYHTFEQLASRFDHFLKREHRKSNTQRGLAIFDKSTTEKSIQNLARTFKHDGHTWGQLRNFSEVPLFLDSEASRLIQLADLVAFAIFRHFEASDSQYFDIIKHCFDFDQGQTHGLHVSRSQE